MKIYLIGFMGCGKTTIGKRLAARLGFGFVDTDEMFSAVHGCSVSDYIAWNTEEKFRQEETKILYRTQEMENTVIALGGGTPCFQDNMQWILANGMAVYIQMSANALYSRLVNSKKKRPLLSSPHQDLKSTIEKLLHEREDVYNKAHTTVQGLDFDMESLMAEIDK